MATTGRRHRHDPTGWPYEIEHAEEFARSWHRRSAAGCRPLCPGAAMGTAGGGGVIRNGGRLRDHLVRLCRRTRTAAVAATAACRPQPRRPANPGRLLVHGQGLTDLIVGRYADRLRYVAEEVESPEKMALRGQLSSRRPHRPLHPLLSARHRASCHLYCSKETLYESPWNLGRIFTDVTRDVDKGRYDCIVRVS